MGMVVRTNTMAINAYRQLGMNNSAVAKSLEKLASGYRINRAGDDAAGLAISEKMKAQIKGLETASANAQDGISLIQTAEGNLNEVHDMLNRMVELSTKSANGTYTSTERQALQDEVDQLLDEIDRISQSANFNGTKLLDGSLALEKEIKSIDVTGNVRTYKSQGSKASFQTTGAMVAYGTATSKAADGDILTVNVGLDDGSSVAVKIKVDGSEGAGKWKLTSLDGKTTYGNALAADGVVALGELNGAVVSALKNTELGDEFKITSENTNKEIKFEALETGIAGRKIQSFDITAESFDGKAKPYATDPTGDIKTTTPIGIKTTVGLNDGIEIQASDITEYDGTNYDDAVFTINGHKFVLLTDTMDGGSTGTANDEYLRAVEALGKDVTVLVGGIGGLMDGAAAGTDPDGANGANGNFAQNIKKIAEVTGLNVTAGVDESTLTPAAGADTGATATSGIRLSIGKGKEKGTGLTLQIGDTADSFNKMTVSVADMSAKGLGLDGLKKTGIMTEASASDAIDTIKNAINSVSTTRAGLGALQNRLEHTINNLDVAAENLSSANSRIRDTDMAKEMMNYTKMNVLVQSAQAMLAQANQQPQSVLQLLQ